ncbi:hypothetical protein Lfu02_49600 [Longispora fulva]|uniref:Uncharacterized protein n=1 Tax=Longispora fulva TaxID=619741 RepID=A0A8J7GMK5_9ACTN|nr:DUF6244 family protein [Longispora fulva]MBG6138335.1 hypothetical protein [Longispora fulva]GIG60588.1 hypothetical protein Lfu02_49600 [Longispora fulva]
MTTTAEILTPLSGAGTEIDEAKTHSAAGRDHADRVFQQARGQGLHGVATSMMQVIAAFDEVTASLITAGTSIRDAEIPVNEIVAGMTPKEVKDRLTKSINAIDRARDAIIATNNPLAEAQRTVRHALDGGEPGPLLGFIQMVDDAAGRAQGQTAKAKTSAQGQIPQASSLGN